MKLGYIRTPVCCVLDWCNENVDLNFMCRLFFEDKWQQNTKNINLMIRILRDKSNFNTIVLADGFLVCM